MGPSPSIKFQIHLNTGGFMILNLRKSTSFFLLFIFGVLAAPVQNLIGEDHVVRSADLQKAIITAAGVRQTNLTKVQKFFSSELARNSFRKAKVDFAKVEKAVPFLTDEELARLASQSDQIQKDLAAGALTNEQLTYIIIALATAVVILVIVAA
jgi:hypothetical protein